MTIQNPVIFPEAVFMLAPLLVIHTNTHTHPATSITTIHVTQIGSENLISLATLIGWKNSQKFQAAPIRVIPQGFQLELREGLLSS